MTPGPDPTRDTISPLGKWPSRFVLDVSIAVMAVFLLMLVLGHHFNSPPFPLERMEQLTVGMSTAEVRAVLGEPTSSHPAAREPTSNSPFDWTYAGFLSWPIVYVHFDEHGRYREWHYDF